MVKRVNLTLNTDNPMDSLIIEMLGGEDYLTSKNIKALLLEIAIKNNSNNFLPQKRNVLVTKKEQKSDKKETKKKRESNTNDTKVEHNSGNNVTEMKQERREKATSKPKKRNRTLTAVENKEPTETTNKNDKMTSILRQINSMNGR